MNKEAKTQRPTYVGTKRIQAELMTRGDYNRMRGWELPKDESPWDLGYLIEYPDGYISWNTQENFEEYYRLNDALTFGMAIELAKQGYKIARKGWNGKGMFVVYQKGYPNGIPCNENTAEAWGMKVGELFYVEPYLQIKMVNGSHSMWAPSINDTLAEDWAIVAD